MAYTVIIADGLEIVRIGLRTLLARVDDIKAVGDAADGRSAVELCKSVRPDLVLIDALLPGLNGLDAARQIIAKSGGTKIVILLSTLDHESVTDSLKIRVSGLLLKSSLVSTLPLAIPAILAGDRFLSPEIQTVVTDDHIRYVPQGGVSVSRASSAREREVLQLIAEGLTTKEIAVTLHLSAKTVETHRAAIAEKTGLRSIASLTKLAIRKGLTSVSNNS